MDSIYSPYTQIARWRLGGFQVLTSPDSKKPPKKKTGSGQQPGHWVSSPNNTWKKLQWWSWGTKIVGEISSTMASIDWSSNSSSRSSFKISACNVEWENLPERHLWRLWRHSRVPHWWDWPTCSMTQWLQDCSMTRKAHTASPSTLHLEHVAIDLWVYQMLQLLNLGMLTKIWLGTKTKKNILVGNRPEIRPTCNQPTLATPPFQIAPSKQHRPDGFLQTWGCEVALPSFFKIASTRFSVWS